MRATEICLRQREEPLLSGSIPDLELDDATFDFHVPAPLIDRYRTVLVLIEYIICESKQQRRLTGARVSEHDYLIPRGDLRGLDVVRLSFHLAKK